MQQGRERTRRPDRDADRLRLRHSTKTRERGAENVDGLGLVLDENHGDGHNVEHRDVEEGAPDGWA